MSSTLEQQVVSIGADGFVFAIVRAHIAEQPHISVTTNDGRMVTASPLAA